MRDDEGELTEETEKAIKEANKKKGMTTEELLKKLGIKPDKKKSKP